MEGVARVPCCIARFVASPRGVSNADFLDLGGDAFLLQDAGQMRRQRQVNDNIRGLLKTGKEGAAQSRASHSSSAHPRIAAGSLATGSYGAERRRPEDFMAVPQVRDDDPLSVAGGKIAAASSRASREGGDFFDCLHEECLELLRLLEPSTSERKRKEEVGIHPDSLSAKEALTGAC